MLMSLKPDIIRLLKVPCPDSLHIFVFLYSKIEPIYRVISNQYYKDHDYRNSLDKTSITIYIGLNDNLRSIKQGAIKNDIENIIDEGEFDMHCLALLKALNKYFLGMRTDLNSLPEHAICYDNYVISKKPQNPIYNHINNRTRNSIGSTISDFLGESAFFITEQPTGFGYKYESVKSNSIRRMNSYLQRKQESFKIAITPFMRTMEIEFRSDVQPGAGNKTPFWAENIKETNAPSRELLKILNYCLEKDITILILPELMVDDYLIHCIRQWLIAHNSRCALNDGKGLFMVIAGSFHHKDDSTNNPRYNRSCILNYNGDILWEHNKMQRYDIDSNDIRNSPDLKTHLNLSENGGYEKIAVGDRLCFIDTPLGRIVVCICIDFFHNDLRKLLTDIQATVFLVPAMSHQNFHFIQSAKSFGDSNKASTFVSNSGCLAKDGEDGASFYYLPSRDKTTSIRYATKNAENITIFDMAEIIEAEMMQK